MFFSAIWGSKNKDLGDSGIEECRHCYEKTNYMLRRERSFLILWIFPIITAKYFAKCRKCGHESEITKSYYKLIRKKPVKK